MLQIAGCVSKHVGVVLTNRIGKPNLPLPVVCHCYHIIMIILVAQHIPFCHLYVQLLSSRTLFDVTRFLLDLLQAHQDYGKNGLAMDQPASHECTGTLKSTCCLCPSCYCSKHCLLVALEQIALCFYCRCSFWRRTHNKALGHAHMACDSQVVTNITKHDAHGTGVAFG